MDYDKGISIMLVGYGHCLSALQGHVTNLHDYTIFNYIGTFFYGFRMPLFFIVSGLLVGRSLNKKGLNNYIGDRTNNILYPLLVWGIIEITFQIIAARYTHFTFHENVSFWKYLKLLANPRETGHFWYLNALFCIGVIYACLKSRLRLGALFQVILGLALFAESAFIHIYDIQAGFLTDIFEYYFFFALGDLISNVMLDEKNISRFSSLKIFFPLLAAFVIIQYFFTEINLRPSAYGDRFVEQKMPFFFLGEALVGCATSVSFSFLLQKYKLFTWIRIVGFHSLFIYCMQIIVMTFARIFFQSLLHVSYTPALIILVWSSGIFLPIIFYNFCLKYNLWWLYTFRKPEKQVEYLRKTNIFSFKTHFQ
ncbi:acyltransferase [Mucilaginibacter sp. L3T2-6]|uniref:acyltransferase family protein n=1 Tax=Mucilaginibacter sp. L3T2-6 TaxID=3062491 RepID=UPI0026751FE5|nr:acyltransferase [Mucilaginibacter sp. L3T2-6]MDO3641484.1 acyltransferase [Mucilaginibacter sp. L3T2-6]MDV6213755.1 acyltransferase [Mucilaginibacter sp. L3T2-6]